MKTLILSVAAVSGLAVASLSQAATITYQITAAAGNFTVTASDSTGDNFGIASYQFTLSNTTTITQVSPVATFTTATFSAFNTTGFALFVSADNVPTVTGSQDTATTGATLNYRIGQQAGTLATNPPAGTPVALGVTRAAYLSPVVLATGTYTGATPVLSNPDGNVFTTATTNGTVEASSFVLVQAPEPASLGLIAVASAGLLRRRRMA